MFQPGFSRLIVFFNRKRDKYGADILRLWALSADYTGEVSLSDDILKQISEVYRKIRNTARYILGNTADYNPDEPVKYENLEEIDKWALTRLNKLIRSAIKNYNNYTFNNCYHDINQFCVIDMSNFYLDIIKDRLYTYKKESRERRSAQTTMYIILDALVKLLLFSMLDMFMFVHISLSYVCVYILLLPILTV